MDTDAEAVSGFVEDSDVPDRILRAATDCYVRFGLGRTTMQQIARVAGVSRATVYRYFSGPGAVRLAVMAQLSSQLFERIEAQITPRDSLERYIAVAFGTLTAFNREMRFNEHLMDPSERMSALMFEEHLETPRFVRRLFGSQLRAAKASGELAKDVGEEDALNMLLIAIDAIGAFSHSSIQQRSPEEVGRWFARMICRGISSR